MSANAAVALRPTPAQPGSRRLSVADGQSIADAPAPAAPTALLTAITAVSVAGWAISLTTIDPARMTDVGLISVVGPLFLCSLALLCIGFGVTLTRVDPPQWLLGTQLVALIVILQATPSLVESEASYFSAYLHVGFIEYITRTGTTLPSLDGRFNWPGGFALMALLTEVAGVKGALYWIRWAPLFFNLLYIAPLWSIANRATRDRRCCWLALWLFFLSNWLHQDYLSPQALGFFLYIAVLAILLQWFRPPRAVATQRGRRPQGLVSWIRRTLRADDIGPDDAPEPMLGTRRRRALVLVVVAVVAAMTMSHQLSPIVLLASTAALAVFRRTTLRSLPVLVGVLVLAWFSLGAETYWLGHLNAVVGSAGDVGGNVKAGLGGRLSGSAGREVILHARIAMAAVVFGLGTIGWLRRSRLGATQFTWVLLVAAPFGVVVGQSYGGEMVLRAYLFALPILVILAAMAIFPISGRGGGQFSRVVCCILGIGLAIGFIATRYGNEQFERVPPGEMAAMRFIYAKVPHGAKIGAASRNLPWRYQQIEGYRYTPIDDSILSDTSALLDFLAKSRHGAYFVSSRSQEQFGEQLYGLRPGWLTEVESRLVQTGRLHEVFSNDDARVYRVDTLSAAKSGRTSP